MMNRLTGIYLRAQKTAVFLQMAPLSSNVIVAVGLMVQQQGASRLQWRHALIRLRMYFRTQST